MNGKVVLCFLVVLGLVRSLSITDIKVVEGAGEREDDPIEEGKSNLFGSCLAPWTSFISK